MKNDTSVDWCRVLDWTNIAEGVISGTIGGVITATIVGTFLCLTNRVTTHRKQKRGRPRKKRRR